ncbi:MAG: 6-bladed beta-propeller [Segetibacter sp.]|nr:6-bladed beta-propeller [Segetibacter sp.]
MQASDKATIGHGSYQYKVLPNWERLDENAYPVKDCHEIVISSKQLLFMLTNETQNNILIYDKARQLKGCDQKLITRNDGSIKVCSTSE